MFKNLFTYVYRYFANSGQPKTTSDFPAVINEQINDLANTGLEGKVKLNKQVIDDQATEPLSSHTEFGSSVNIWMAPDIDREIFLPIKQATDDLPLIAAVNFTEDIVHPEFKVSSNGEAKVEVSSIAYIPPSDLLDSEPQSKNNLDHAVRRGNVKVVGYYSITKAGNTAAECEDAYAWHEQDNAFCFAVSDGATESSFSREWAIELVNELIQRPIWQEIGITPSLNEWLLPLQSNWTKWLTSQNLIWFAKRKAEQGTFATLIGFEINHQNQWQVFAVGDSCLFMVRDSNLLHSFPLKHSSELGYRPYLIGTIVQNELPRVMHYLSGTAQSGDRFYLVTDALASWIFTSMEANQNPWVQLDQISNQAAFFDWVESLRNCQAIPNDDTTMIHIEVQ